MGVTSKLMSAASPGKKRVNTSTDRSNFTPMAFLSINSVTCNSAKLTLLWVPIGENFYAASR